MTDAERYTALVHALEDLMSSWDEKRNALVAIRDFGGPVYSKSRASIVAETMLDCVMELDAAMGSITRDAKDGDTTTP